MELNDSKPASTADSESSANEESLTQAMTDEEVRAEYESRFGTESGSEHKTEVEDRTPDYEPLYTVLQANGRPLHLCSDGKWRINEQLADGSYGKYEPKKD